MIRKQIEPDQSGHPEVERGTKKQDEQHEEQMDRMESRRSQNTGDTVRDNGFQHGQRIAHIHGSPIKAGVFRKADMAFGT